MVRRSSRVSRKSRSRVSRKTRRTINSPKRRSRVSRKTRRTIDSSKRRSRVSRKNRRKKIPRGGASQRDVNAKTDASLAKLALTRDINYSKRPLPGVNVMKAMHDGEREISFEEVLGSNNRSKILEYMETHGIKPTCIIKTCPRLHINKLKKIIREHKNKSDSTGFTVPEDQ